MGRSLGGWHTAVGADGRNPAGRAAGTSTAVGWSGAANARERNPPTGDGVRNETLARQTRLRADPGQRQIVRGRLVDHAPDDIVGDRHHAFGDRRQDR